MVLLRLSCVASALCFAAALQMVYSAALPGFQECMLFGRRYAIGDAFHPIVDVNGMEYEAVCYECICQPTTIAQCEAVHCPPTECSTPIRLAGECCPVCLEPQISPQEVLTCLYDGVVFADGDVFHPPSMMEAKHMNDSAANPFCIECTCDAGYVTCKDISTLCPPLPCNESEASTVDGTCCKVCPTGPPPEPQPGCRDSIDGRFYPEGATWNPFYPGFGLIDCIDCTCNNSQVICERQPCPMVPVCGPEDPVPDLVICCPKCTSIPPSAYPTSPPNNTNSTSLPNNTTSTPYPNGTNTTTGPVKAPNLIPCDVVNTYRIYKHASYDSMALVNTETQRAEVYSWTLSLDGQVMRSYEESSADEFYAREDNNQFVFIGYTIPRRVNGLTAKESKRRKIEACMMNCSQMVVNMLRPQASSTTCEEERKM